MKKESLSQNTHILVIFCERLSWWQGCMLLLKPVDAFLRVQPLCKVTMLTFMYTW